MAIYKPATDVLELIEPFAAEFHETVDEERSNALGLHDLNLIEYTYQITLEAAAAILLAANSTHDPIHVEADAHSSKAGGDDHFAPWGTFLTGITCDPLIAMFPVYYLMCQSFSFEPLAPQADYIYAALTCKDWAKPGGPFNDKIATFEKEAIQAAPNLDDQNSGQDRSFWRIAHAYLRAVNRCENARPFKAPRTAAIPHPLGFDMVVVMRAFDTLGSAYMCSDGAAWLDDAGIDSLIGAALPNDIMDLHTDIMTGETRNILRLIYPDGLTMDQAISSVSTILSGLMGEFFRGHKRARFDKREDGRIAATSPAYGFCRARHRRVFEKLEVYIERYPQFWDWAWEILALAQAQLSDAGLSEPLHKALRRSVTHARLPTAPANKFYAEHCRLIRNTEPLDEHRPMGLSGEIGEIIRQLHHMWHVELRLAGKAPGWGKLFDIESDRLFGEAGRILAKSSDPDGAYRFTIAYGRLCMGLPYLAYHAVDAIIMARGIIPN